MDLVNYSYLADGSFTLGSLIYRKIGSRWDVATGLTDHTNRFRYNSKEEQFRFGTPYIDYGARQYDPVVGRWFA